MLSLSDELKANLSPLFDLPSQLLQDFCRLGSDLLNRGRNIKLYSAAAQKLQVEVHVIQLSVEALVQLIAKGRQYNLSKSEFRDVSLASGFNEEQEAVLSEFYESCRVSVDAALVTLAPSTLHYHDLEWRFDVQVASRSLIKQTIPSLILKLSLAEKPQTASTDCKRLLLQTDPNNLKHLIKKLEEALSEAKSHHSRRILRNFEMKCFKV